MPSAVTKIDIAADGNAGDYAAYLRVGAATPLPDAAIANVRMGMRYARESLHRFHHCSGAHASRNIITRTG